MKDLVKILEENIKEAEEGRRRTEEQNQKLMADAVEAIKVAFSNLGYETENLVFMPRPPFHSSFRKEIEVTVEIAPRGYQLSLNRTYPPALHFIIREGQKKLDLEELEGVLEDLTNPIYWDKIPEPIEPVQETSTLPSLEDEVKEIKDAIRKIIEWASE